jgi:hypothetical protein
MERYLKTRQLFFGRWVLPCLLCLVVLLTGTTALWAAFGEDTELPRPEFSRQGETITAKLIPRGRTTSIQIDFAASGGHLSSVEALDFAKAASPNMDKKDFRSGLFIVKAGGIQPGGDLQVSMASNYFTKSTQFWIFNPNAAKPWIRGKAKYARAPDRVEELRVTVKDGGPLDSDGQANGQIVLMFGPRDSFWGYAIGTLFIRFFGVILVLTVLLIGMVLASKVFRFIENRVAPGRAEREPAPIKPFAVPEMEGPAMDEGKAAAIAVVLHLHLAQARPATVWHLLPPETPAWSQAGRARLMSERAQVFNRENQREWTRLSR